MPDWPAPAGVRAVFTTRHGGQSKVPWESFNLGDHVGDAAADVAANRAALHAAIGARPVFLKQVHGGEMLNLDEDTVDGQTADACITAERQVACTVLVADCLPVLLATEDGTRVAAAHAGWRGLAGVGGAGAGERGGKGVLEAVFKSLRPPAQSGRAQAAIKIIAWMGPCIGPSAFEVGPEVKAAFESADPAAGDCFAASGSGKHLADLPGLARRRLQALGVTALYGNDSSPAWCTVSNPSRFFSHRGSGGLTGRMAACIWRV